MVQALVRTDPKEAWKRGFPLRRCGGGVLPPTALLRHYPTTTPANTLAARAYHARACDDVVSWLRQGHVQKKSPSSRSETGLRRMQLLEPSLPRSAVERLPVQSSCWTTLVLADRTMARVSSRGSLVSGKSTTHKGSRYAGLAPTNVGRPQRCRIVLNDAINPAGSGAELGVSQHQLQSMDLGRPISTWAL